MKISIAFSSTTFFLFVTLNTSSAQWIQANGHYSRHIRSFSVSNGRIFAIAQNSIFLSTSLRTEVYIP